MTAPRMHRKRADVPAPETAPDTPDPIEIALKAVAADADGHPLARAVLEKHAKLLDVQCQREREEWSVLRVQRWTRWLILGAVVALLVGIAALLWNASRSTSLVIEPFEVPPQLAQRGLTGKVVSARVLDELARLQRDTESMRGAKSYANDWQGDIKLDIPQTGLSVGEAWRTLKGWLGAQTSIGGEIVLAPQGALGITTRAGAESGGTVAGPADDFDRLVGEAAARLYRITQPYRFAISRRDPNEAIVVLTELTGAETELDRKWAYSGLSATYRRMGDEVKALAMAERALAIDPNLLPAIGNLGLAHLRAGHLPQAAAAFERHDATFRQFGNDDIYDNRVATLNQLSSEATLAMIIRNAPALLRTAARLDEFSASSFNLVSTISRREAALIGHDPRRAAALTLPVAQDPDDAAEAAMQDAVIAMQLAAARGDPAGVRSAAVIWSSEMARVPPTLHRSRRIATQPYVAILLAQAGLPRAAASLSDRLPNDCYDCVRAKGWAALAAGDRVAARRWFAEAVRQGPALPAARVDLGRLQLLEGRFDAGLAELRKAARLSPNWADPLRYEGDALLRAGKPAEARAAYARAAKAAPNWGSLRLIQGRLLTALGDGAGARAAFAAAGRATLTPAERARLAQALSALAARP
ncbi:MAG: tetratricopeptide repeat protein [Pseudomonadota bacterium]